MSIHKVKKGECIDSIAKNKGFHWQTLWTHKSNNSLKEKRKDPFVLMEGDEIFVPELTRKLESRSTDARHRFRRLSVPSRFRIQVCVGDKPLANQPFEAVVDGVKQHLGQADSEGWVEFPIAADAIQGELWVGDSEENGREYVLLEFGCLDPITEISGLQHRLINIGFAVGEENVLDEYTRGAIAEFQQMMKIESTGEPDQHTLDLLLKFHGS